MRGKPGTQWLFALMDKSFGTSLEGMQTTSEEQVFIFVAQLCIKHFLSVALRGEQIARSP